MPKASGTLARRAPANSLSLDALRAAKLAALGLTDEHARQAAQIFVRDLSSADPEVQREAAREILKLTGSYPSKTHQAGGDGVREIKVNLAVFAQPPHPGSTLGPSAVTDVQVIPAQSASTP